MSFMDKLFDLLTFVAGAVAVCIVAALPFACTAHEDRLIAEAIKNGTDPLTAKCALGIENGRCVYMLQKGAPK